MTEIWKDSLLCKGNKKSKSHPVWNACRCEFPYVNSPLVCLTVHKLSNYPDLIGILLILLENPKSLPICNQHRKNVTYSRGWTVISGHKEFLILKLLQIIFYSAPIRKMFTCLFFHHFPAFITQKRPWFSRCYEKMEDERSACITWSNKDA